MTNIFRDLRYSARRLSKSPVFTLTTVLTLAIGIGANTAIFSMMDALVLRPLGVPELDRIVNITERPIRGQRRPVSLANYRDWKEHSRSFAALAIYTSGSMNLTGAGEPEHLTVSQVEPSFFDVFKARPILGRTFAAGEATPGRDGIAVLSYGLWQQQFAGNPRVLGKSIELDHRKYTIVGVVSQTFRYPPSTRLWVPMISDPVRQTDRSRHDASVVARLRSGVTLNQAQSELADIAVQLARLYPATNTGWTVRIRPLLNTINGDLMPGYMRMVFGASGFLLLVICANLTNLQVARAVNRRAEIAIRSALGAGRSQLLQQLFVENFLLAVFGAGCGIVFAQFFLDRITGSLPPAVARYLAGWDTLHLSNRALACACIAAILCAIFSGLAPAISSFRIDVIDQLKSGTRSISASKGTDRLRNLFVIAQITFAMALVVGSALIAKGMWAMTAVTQTYSPEERLIAEIDLPHDRYATPDALRAWFTASIAKLRVIPGVEDIATTTALPYSNGGPWSEDFAVDEKRVEPGSFQAAQRLTVTSNYLAIFHIPLVNGRSFTSSDGPGSQPVALVSRSFVLHYLPKGNPVGHKVRFTGPGETIPPLTIVGVAEDVLYSWTDKYPEPAVYIDASQFPSGAATYVIRSREIGSNLRSEFRAAIKSLNPALPIDRLQTYAAYLNESLVGLKYVVVMLLEDAVIALLLSSIGIFGIIAISVAERTREIGIRLALGAQGREVVALLLRRAFQLTAAGLMIGILLALWLMHLLSSLFYGVEPQDTGILALNAGLIAIFTLAASYLAARRAAAIDPMRALQSE